jgi:hypothetical protein
VISEGGRGSRQASFAVVLLAVAACGNPGSIDTAARSPDARRTPAPASVANLSFTPTGIVG